ncbi:hypothetical protein FKM82_023098 [Ascaphus truei]
MEPELTERYDHALLGILQHVGNIQDFLSIYFGFLYRKTDFYRLLLNPQDRLGFPPGTAQGIVLQTFKAYERLALEDHEQRVRGLQEKVKRKTKEELRGADIIGDPLSAQEVIIESAASEAPMKERPSELEPTEELAERSEVSGGSMGAAQEAEVSRGSTGAAKEAEVSGDSTGAAQAAEVSGDSTGAAQVAEVSGGSTGGAEVSGGCTGAEVSEGFTGAAAAEHKEQGDFQMDPDSYNGAVRRNYTWSQDYADLEIKIPVHKGVIKGKQVTVDLRSTCIRVAVIEGGGERVLMEGNFTHKINAETSLWSLEPGKCILISLSKCGEYWWNAILDGEETIDIDKINKERSMATVDDEEHAVLDRLTFDYHQKLQGKPQSHEMVRSTVHATHTAMQ